MTTLDLTIRRANAHDAATVAPLINLAGEGLPFHFWSQLAAPGQDPWDVARERLASPDGMLETRDAWIGLLHGQEAGFLLGYLQPAEPATVPEDAPGILRPLIELEAEAPDSFYINVLATRPGMERQGVASRMLEHAGKAAGPAGMSLIVSDANAPARRLYERHGFTDAARRPMVSGGWQAPGKEWVLMVRGR
ncbi:N-acetyltransferase [Maritimibacter sp. HL-12]|uniref:GNAT family N-acetyltransferase n=1 Tax=Maritimibacter sp. HL-12 TaxID=1162418 RepID=UPI000A0F36F0|nr:N-acetyltransferase [Maritimibacter sp. HL-12]SMH57096.1 Ribosomal protein S18 acetylase RimI [Maritimibacter sp. HL-12]